jgi:DNA mismatch repair protein MutS2
VPELTRPSETFSLRALRHPLLVLQGKKVVPSDVRIDPPARALIISGPNAGGKTVTLTGVGLCALMLRLGLPIPVGEGSRMPLYPGVYAAIGDAQDLGRDLSTFSAHLTALRDILLRSSPGALVLIDEMAADTDPREGAALASAVLEELLERGATVLVTTHLEELKALGLAEQARFANAHVGFDPEKLAPTYRLHLGSPGASSAIDIAARVGLPEALCQRARAHLSGATGPLAKALEALEETRRALDLERAQAAQATAKARADLALAEQKLQEIEERGRKEAEAARQKLLRDLESAQVQVSSLVAELQVAPTLAKAAEAQRALRQQETEQRAELARLKAEPEEPAEREGEVRVGGRVRIAPLQREGEVVELKGQDAVVQAGAMRLRVPVADLVPLKGKARLSPKLKEGGGAAVDRARSAAAAAVSAPAESCDVRGLRADEALRMVETFLDRLYGEGRPVAYIVHGHGTGALKQSLREYLDASPYVRTWRPAENTEGGDGATRVELGG